MSTPASARGAGGWWDGPDARLDTGRISPLAQISAREAGASGAPIVLAPVFLGARLWGLLIVVLTP